MAFKPELLGYLHVKNNTHIQLVYSKIINTHHMYWDAAAGSNNYISTWNMHQRCFAFFNDIPVVYSTAQRRLRLVGCKCHFHTPYTRERHSLFNLLILIK